MYDIWRATKHDTNLPVIYKYCGLGQISRRRNTKHVVVGVKGDRGKDKGMENGYWRKGSEKSTPCSALKYIYKHVTGALKYKPGRLKVTKIRLHSD